MDTQQAPWRMTHCELQVLLDLEAFARMLGDPLVPDQLICLVMRARKGGKPWKTLRELAFRGYILRDDKRDTWTRTSKRYPTTIVGEKPNTISGGAITRLVRLWNDGRRDLTKDDLEELRTDIHNATQRAVIKRV